MNKGNFQVIRGGLVLDVEKRNVEAFDILIKDNLIAEVGVGAGVGVKAALQIAEENGKKLGKVIYIFLIQIWVVIVVILTF